MAQLHGVPLAFGTNFSSHGPPELQRYLGHFDDLVTMFSSRNAHSAEPGPRADLR